MSTSRSGWSTMRERFLDWLGTADQWSQPFSSFVATIIYVLIPATWVGIGMLTYSLLTAS